MGESLLSIPTMATKCKTNTFETKYKAILEVEKGLMNKTQIAKDLDVPLTTLSTWLKKADDYKKAYETPGFGPQNKRMMKADFEDVDDALQAWIRESHAHDIPISGPILQAKAQPMDQGIIVSFKSNYCRYF